VAPAPKLSDRDVKRIRRRIHTGERQTDIAHEFDVNRRTIRRRLDELERADTERAGHLAAKRVRRQAAREKLKLLERERDSAPAAPIEQTQRTERAGAPNGFLARTTDDRLVAGRSRRPSAALRYQPGRIT
jgi:DNA-binding GntR family transcriptional regulator